MDEVSFSALLHQRRYREAFALAPNPRELLPFVAVFGERAEVNGSDLPLVGSRFVIAQGGPGDGIRFAGTYRALRPRSNELVVTCDPRLLTLLAALLSQTSTSCPVERLNGRRPGGFGPGSPPRSGDVLFKWMTAEARRAGAGTATVYVLERSLYHLTLDPSAAGAVRRVPPSLEPSWSRQFAQRSARGVPTGRRRLAERAPRAGP